MPELQANLGLMYYQMGKDKEAIEAFHHAARLKPGMLVPHLFLGLEYVKLKRFSEAIPHFKQAALVKPSDVQVQFGLGQAYAGDGKTRLASAAYARASELDPGNADAWYHLGVSYLEQVEADARVLLTRHRDSAYVQMLTAETFAEQRAFNSEPKKPIKRSWLFRRFLPARMPVTVLSCSTGIAWRERSGN